MMKKIVLVGGCFDLLHYGHINFLKQAKSRGDWLVVALESDENVKRMKGNARPIHIQAQRKEMLEALSFIDEVISLPPMHNDRDYFELVRKIRPAIIAHGTEYQTIIGI
ncbi:MAG: adenylyltransferase/cytidyltransferase family protein [Candidatus Gottesmanbacteria bacterium]|nr:adenylyltransferase/cytidyltransferase family protein [Candidatus Gottesmanbacteria bacterium]